MTETRAASPRPARGASPAVRAAVAVALGLWMALATQAFTPDLPHTGLDASWVAVMGEAADRGWRWGRDLAFTYGPASPLVTHYGNDAYLPLTLPLLLATQWLFAAGAVRLAGGGIGRAVLAAAVLALIAPQVAGTPDAVFLVLPLLPALLVLQGPVAGARPLAMLSATALGALGLAKMSYPLAALPVLLVADGTLMARRRPPILLLSFVVGLLAADLAYRQSLSDLPAYLRLQGEVVAGYSEAMALPGSRRELLAVLLAMGMLWLGAVLGRRGAAGRLPAAAGLGWVLFMLFKAGFVRQDLHTLIAWNGLALAAALLALAGNWRPAAQRIVLAAAVAGPVLFNAGAAVAPGTAWGTRLQDVLAFERARLATDPALQARAALALFEDPAGAAEALRHDRAEAWRAAAAAAPLPVLEGGVDVIPSRQNAVVASGLDYRPRPSFQDYSTYTEGLAAANRAFLEGPRAPAWVLFGPEPDGGLTIDGRYPNLAEGALWPDLLTLYRPERRIGDLLALRRRAVPRDLGTGPARRGTARLGAMVPFDGRAPAVLATLDLRPTLLGRLAGLLFRPALPSLTVRLADGSQRSYRFVTGLGRSGFVLSPLVTDAAEFAALAGAGAPDPGRRVVAFSVAGRAGLLSDSFDYTLQPLSLPVPGEARAAP